jgi:hypothetical protein
MPPGRPLGVLKDAGAIMSTSGVGVGVGREAQPAAATSTRQMIENRTRVCDMAFSSLATTWSTDAEIGDLLIALTRYHDRFLHP